MPTFDREAALAAGYSPAEVDSMIQAGPPPGINRLPTTEASAGVPGAGFVGAAVDAASGLKGVGIGAGAATAAYVGKKLLGAKKTRAGTPRRGGDKLPTSLVAVTKEDIKNHPELKNYKTGDPIRRVRMEQIKMGPPPKSGGPEIPESAAKRIEAGKTPTRPIEIVEGSQRTPARAPAQTKEPPYSGGRGASGPELGRRAAAQARYAAPAPAMAPDDGLEELLRRSVHAEGAMTELGVPKGQARLPLRASLRSAGGGLAALLPFLLGSQDIPQQMDEARQVGFEGTHPNISPALRRALLEELAGL